MEEVCIHLRGRKIRIFAFMNKNVSIRQIMKHWKVPVCDFEKTEISVVIVDKISKKDRFFKLRQCIEKGDILIISSNKKIKFPVSNIKAITYGVDEKSTISFSSVGEMENDEFILCIQRNFTSIFQKEYEPMEIKIEEKKTDIEVNTLLGILTLKMVLEIE